MNLGVDDLKEKYKLNQIFVIGLTIAAKDTTSFMTNLESNLALTLN